MVNQPGNLGIRGCLLPIFQRSGAMTGRIRTGNSGKNSRPEKKRNNPAVNYLTIGVNMLIKLDCIPCILKMTISSIRHLALDEESVQELYCKILKIPSLRGEFWDITSAEVVELAWKKIVNTTKNKDPLCLL